MDLSNLIGLICAAAYLAFLGIALRRGSFLRIATTAAIAVAIVLGAGTLSWIRPHQDAVSFRRFDWPCHATGGLLSILLLAVCSALALSTAQRWQADGVVKVAGAVVFAALAILACVVLELHLAVMVLGCDTL